ncbi:hypothetical protein [Hymenobacter psoromatis]|uniref:hypothetical protein n=1 Tax=Hymenobacter psoromatis TaxID=1484116 RepID=UPI001CBAE309|nr:hypothetical protein [Hymenobacter psoromatis]
MASDNDLDDLFRQQLGPHATPPSADLQRHLAELAEAERLDSLFRAGLGSHASPPRRALWERLEDEHLHPPVRRRRGIVAWWQLSAAAMLLLALLAGGLWRSGYLGPRPGLAVGKPAVRLATGSSIASSARPAAPTASSQPIDKNLANNTIAQPEKEKQENLTRQATAGRLVLSSHPIAATTRPRRTAAGPQVASSFSAQRRQPDAAAGPLATTGRRHNAASQPHLPTPRVAPETPASLETPPQAIAAAVPIAPAGIVEVDVRRGPEPTRPAPTPTVAATEPRPERRPRLRLGGLLRQADRLAHGEGVSLADATGPAESLTVQARIGGRLVSKTIQL